jgi:YfiH family protein
MMLQSRLLSALGPVRHGFFTREGGVSNGLYASLNGGTGSKDKPEHVTENRTRMAAALGCSPRSFLTAHQVHSPDVVIAATPWSADDKPRADAIVTRMPSLAIGISTADCGPVLMADVEGGVIGAAHAGWRGALTGVLEATVDTMEGLGARRERIIAALGPMIRQQNYEVGQDVIAKFTNADAASKAFFAPATRKGHAMFDLAGYIVARLKRAGVDCDDLGVCTYADEARCYSFRRSTHRNEPDYGRHINSIMLV